MHLTCSITAVFCACRWLSFEGGNTNGSHSGDLSLAAFVQSPHTVESLDERGGTSDVLHRSRLVGHNKPAIRFFFLGCVDRFSCDTPYRQPPCKRLLFCREGFTHAWSPGQRTTVSATSLSGCIPHNSSIQNNRSCGVCPHQDLSRSFFIRFLLGLTSSSDDDDTTGCLPCFNRTENEARRFPPGSAPLASCPLFCSLLRPLSCCLEKLPLSVRKKARRGIVSHHTSSNQPLTRFSLPEPSVLVGKQTHTGGWRCKALLAATLPKQEEGSQPENALTHTRITFF